MRAAFFVYEGFTLLDLAGPLEVLSLLPDIDILVVAERAGIIWPDNQVLPVVAPFGIDDFADADLLLVPGGSGTMAQLTNRRLLDWIAAIDSTTAYTVSVCTGSLLLAAAGLLRAKPATTHWAAMDMLRELGAVPVAERYVESGKILTAAGVSAGIDAALALAARVAGEATARAIQLGIEYDPDPPFNAGSPGKAGAAIGELLMSDATAFLARSARIRPHLQ